MKKHKTFETERLYIRPTSVDDAEFILKLMNSPNWIKYIGERNIKTIESAKSYIETKMVPQLERLGYSNYTVITREGLIKIGTCGLYDRKGLDGIDIGFAFLPEFEKKGFAFESANKLKNLAFDEFGIKIIKAVTTKDNIASQNLLKKLGLKYIENINLPNDKEELMLYRITKEN